MLVTTWLNLVLLSFACFRLTRLIVYDQITAFLRKPFHELIEEEDEAGHVETYLKIKGTGLRHWLGELLSCYWCTGMWCTITLVTGLWLLPIVFQPIVFVLGIAGIAAIIEVIVSRLIE